MSLARFAPPGGAAVHLSASSRQTALSKYGPSQLAPRVTGTALAQVPDSAGSPQSRLRLRQQRGPLRQSGAALRGACRPKAAGAESGARDASQSGRKVSVPNTAEESLDQATSAVRKAIADGHKNLFLDLLLPLIGPSLLDDWPGGIQQQLKAATPLIKSLLSGIVAAEDASLEFGGCSRTLLSEEDSVVLWESDQLALVLFPTAEQMPQLQNLRKAFPQRPLLIVNPQWQPGQVVSDFGFGQRKKEAEDFLAGFLVAYSLQNTRIRGSNVTVVRCYPSDWCVYQGDERGEVRLVGALPDKPKYREIEDLLKGADARDGTSTDWLTRFTKEINFLKNSK